MDSPIVLALVAMAIAAAVCLGAVRVHPAIVGALSTIAPLILVVNTFFKENTVSVNEQISAFVTWGLLAVIMYATPAFLIGFLAASLGAFLTRGRSRGRSSSNK